MKFEKKINSVFDIFIIKKNILIFNDDKKEMINIFNNNHLSISYIRHTKNYIYDILVGEILIYDDTFEFVSKIIDSENTQFNSSVEEIDNSWILLLSKRDSEKKLISEFKIIRNDKILYQSKYCGKILSNYFRLNFKYEERFSPRTFRCSDLLDTQTYWEYDCGEGFTALRFYIWNDTLFFVKGNDRIGLLVMIDLATGNVVWETEPIYGEFHFDDEKGLLVSVWGNKYEGNNYQVINLNNKSIVVNKIESQLDFHSVGLGYSTINDHFVYFIDNPVKYGVAWQFDTPRIGCFDYLTKKLLYFKEIPELKEKGINQLLVQSSKFYCRTPDNELYIFEENG